MGSRWDTPHLTPHLRPLCVLTWELVAGSLPWASSEKGDKWREIVVYEAILAGLPLFPKHFSQRLKKFLTALLERNPEGRLSAGEAKQESWLGGILWNQLWAMDLHPPSMG